ncbi:MAG: hypothetical protein OEL76_16490 [Siculibacillus sp.]|nr:hypothetical protein [Siculibacillus sp.]
MRRFRLDLAAEVRRLVKTVGVVAVAAAALAIVASFTTDPLAFFFRVVGLVCTALLVVSVLVTVLTFRRARAVRPAPLAIAIATSLVCTGFNLAFAARLPAASTFVLAGGAGLLVGVAWSLTMLLFVDGEEVRGRGTLWYLVVWALTLAANQLTVLVTGRTPAIATILMLVGAGLAVANSAGLILRVRATERRRGATHREAVATAG